MVVGDGLALLCRMDGSRLVHGVMVGGRKSVGQAGRPAYIVLLGRRSRTFHLMEDDSISGVQWN